MDHKRASSAQRYGISRHKWHDYDAVETPHSALGTLEPRDIALRAYDALHIGLLIVSHEGIIIHYNSVYEQLRKIPLGAMIGRPIIELDRRGSVRSFLETGISKPEKSVHFEMRRNKEIIVPIQEGPQLLGCAVLVQPMAEPFSGMGAGGRRRVTRSSTPWATQYSVADIIGNSPALVRARELAMQAASVNSAVLLLGESGTGKELFAHAIHARSPWHDRPFVPVDCSALSRELLETELFGYAPGAFTGALKEGKPGKFELADGGTVFLDEIGEMPIDMQAKLLRVLQEHRIVRVGGVTPIPVDFRIIAATNRNLESMVSQGRFRHDLLYRLDVIRIEIPPLRERPEDIPLLLKHTWQCKSQALGCTTMLSPQALEVLSRYHWPGNIRELMNLVERLLVSACQPIIGPHDLPLYMQQDCAERVRDGASFSLKTVVAEAERQALGRALQHTQGNRNLAAELVGLSRASFYRKLKEYGLTHDIRDQELIPSL